jgi:uncharacterized membrane protein YsdA (DUF1294 family)
MKILFIYLFTVNALGLLLMLADKYKAKKKLWRIPEATLMGVALCGGSFGCLLGMRIARHKTKHPKFSVGLPVILAVQVVIFVVCMPLVFTFWFL